MFLEKLYSFLVNKSFFFQTDTCLYSNTHIARSRTILFEVKNVYNLTSNMLSCLQNFLISQKCPRNLAIYHVYELISDEKYVHIWFYNIFELHGRNFKLDVNTISNFHLEISLFYQLSLCHFAEYFFQIPLALWFICLKSFYREKIVITTVLMIQY